MQPQPLLSQGSPQAPSFQHSSSAIGDVSAIKQSIAQLSPDELAELQRELKQQRLQRQHEELVSGSCALITSISMPPVPGSSLALALALAQQPARSQHLAAAQMPLPAFDQAELANLSEELRAVARVLQQQQQQQQTDTWQQQQQQQQQQQRCDAPRGSSSPQEHFNNYAAAAAAAQPAASAVPDAAAAAAAAAADTGLDVYQQQLARLQEVLNSSAFAAAPNSAPAAADEHTCAVLELLRQVEKALRAQLDSGEPLLLQHSAAGPPQAPATAQQPPRSPETPVLLHHQWGQSAPVVYPRSNVGRTRAAHIDEAARAAAAEANLQALADTLTTATPGGHASSPLPLLGPLSRGIAPASSSSSIATVSIYEAAAAEAAALAAVRHHHQRRQLLLLKQQELQLRQQRRKKRAASRPMQQGASMGGD